MAITEARKKTLVTEYGENGCLKQGSILKAIYRDMTGQFRLYIDDYPLLHEASYCVPIEPETPVITETEKQGILVRCSETDADVYINGVWAGKAGRVIEKNVGSFNVKVQKEGFYPYSFVMEVTTGKTTTTALIPLNAKTTEKPVTSAEVTGIKITCNVSNAAISIDNSPAGTAGELIELPAGEHVVEVSAPGYVSKRFAVVIYAGITTTPAKVILASETAGEEPVEEEPAIENKPLLVKTGNVQLPTGGVKLAADNWFGVEVRNDGNADWRGYLGVRLVDETGMEWVYEGSQQYTMIVNPGETKMLKVKVYVPKGVLKAGKIKSYIRVNSLTA